MGDYTLLTTTTEKDPNNGKDTGFVHVCEGSNDVASLWASNIAAGRMTVVEADFNENLFIPKKCKHPEWAKTFMKWFATEEGCKAWTKNSSSIRPFNLSEGNNYLDSVYNEVSDFCKSVIDISKDYQLYYCNSDNLMSVCQQAKYRPAGYYFENLRKGKTAYECVNGDYNTANRDWETWVDVTKSTFPDIVD